MNSNFLNIQKLINFKQMKRIYLILAVLFCFSLVEAQDEDYHNDEFKTVFGGKKIGGYGGIGLGYTTIDSKPALVFDARGGVILAHSFTIGIGGAGFINTYEYDPALNKDVSLVGGYGGFFVEPILFPKSRVHLSFPVLVGIGGAAYTSWIQDTNQDYPQSSNVEETSVFLVLEPAAELEFNFTRFFRLAAFLSYRYASDLDLTNVGPEPLNEFSAGLRFKFGKF
jgi:hypothetical protein